MKNPLLKLPILLNVVIVIISGVICPVPLLFGFAHLIEGITQIIDGTSPNHPPGVAMQGWITVIFLCIVGIGFVVLGLAALIAIIKKVKKLII